MKILHLFAPPLMLLLVFFLALHQAPLFYAADSTISANRSLSGSQKITSEGGNFALGFFKPPRGSSDNYYVGIWYNWISELTPVWVANREIPVTDPTKAELRISGDGNLVLLNQSESIIWSSSADISSGSTVAVILDDGNLELRDESNSSMVFWQSFSHPTDTWLPGCKLGQNNVSNQPQHLTAWRNRSDPAPGNFSVQIDLAAAEQLNLFWNMSRKYWAGQIREMCNLPFPEYFGTDPSNYISCTTYNNTPILRLVMDVSGRIQLSQWVEYTKSWINWCTQPPLVTYPLCGCFCGCDETRVPVCRCLEGFTPTSQSEWNFGNWTRGCTRRTPLQCDRTSSSSDSFLEISDVRLPEDSTTFVEIGNREACRLACLSKCSCSAYSYSITGGCSMWYGDLFNLQVKYKGSDQCTLSLRLAASELQGEEVIHIITRSKNRTVTWATVGVITAILAFFVTWVITRRCCPKKKAGGSNVLTSSLVPFRYSELKIATRNFSQYLGRGGFGSVFKGSLLDSTAIAVKKLEDIHRGEKQFKTEVSTLGIIQHVNLVRLYGFCSHGTKRFLVYEFVSNGSLNTHLFHTNSNALEWKARYQIALGTARGLAYLHEQCRECIIHCDIKPENILLDGSFVPKVADFGLAKLLGRNFSRVLTTIRGSRGYLAPEWLTGLAITPKVDVYSYGMMLFEIISGRRNLKQTGSSSLDFFPISATSKLIAGDIQSLLDPRLEGEANLEELERACKIASWCIQDDETSRPTMTQVVQALEGILDMSMPPIPRSLQLLTDDTALPCNFSSTLTSSIYYSH